MISGWLPKLQKWTTNPIRSLVLSEPAAEEARATARGALPAPRGAERRVRAARQAGGRSSRGRGVSRFRAQRGRGRPHPGVPRAAAGPPFGQQEGEDEGLQPDRRAARLRRVRGSPSGGGHRVHATVGRSLPSRIRSRLSPGDRLVLHRIPGGRQGRGIRLRGVGDSPRAPDQQYDRHPPLGGARRADGILQSRSVWCSWESRSCSARSS